MFRQGGPQHIKSKFGKGFQIIIKVGVFPTVHQIFFIISSSSRLECYNPIPFPQLEPMSEAVNGIGNGHQNQATKSVQNKEDALKLLRDSVVKAVINHFKITSSAETLKESIGH